MVVGPVLCDANAVNRRFSPALTFRGGPKPRVLLADDNRRFLDSVSSLLSDTFEVVGIATDGLQALDAARHVEPDVIVLDVDMPVLDGLQTCRAFQQSGAAAPPVVFLSMHDGKEVVSSAFRCGGQGYVLKQRAGQDLVQAIEHALDGRSFVPSLASLRPLAAHGLHAMQLYQDEDLFVDGLAELFDLALRDGDATCIIAGRRICDGLADRLRAQGWPVGGSPGHRRYLALDANDAIARVMRNGRPDRGRLAEIVGELETYRRAESEGTGSRLTVCGNISGMLIAGGNTPAALALEHEWNALTNGRPFLTVCGYSSSCFHDDRPGLWRDTCTEHRAVSYTTDV